MNWLLKFCIRERMLVAIAAIGLLAFGWYSTQEVPIDAIPNVGENQVIVLTEWPGRSPRDVEDQVTYPLSIALQAVPGSQSVRGKSMFGFSFVQVTFEDGVDFYWARSRVAEQLTTITGSLPDGATPALAPDATALGQVYYYVLEGPPGVDLARLRSMQDFHVKYALQSVEGVAEVASIGGYERQYQVEVDPNKLRYHRVPLNKVISAVKAANIDVGAKTVETGGMEFIVRGRGFIGSGKTEAETIEQIEQTVLMVRNDVPLTVADVATVQTGPAFRRGALDLNGAEAVGGVVVMRYGENPRRVIERVKEKARALEAELGGVRITGIYDRTQLIDETVGTLTTALMEETLITIVVMLLFLLHVRASLVIAITLPMAVLIAFIAMNLFGVDANIMSLAGIAIAIGTMVDMGIIILENIYDGIAEWEEAGSPGGPEHRPEVIRKSAGEVVPAVITAVSTTIVSFLPVFFLTGRDHRLFAPLAWTKTFSLVASLVVAVTLVPSLCRWFLSSSRLSGASKAIAAIGLAVISGLLCWFVWGHRIPGEIAGKPIATALAVLVGAIGGWWVSGERILPMDRNPVSRFVRWVYGGRLRFALKHKTLSLIPPLLLVVIGLGAWIGMPVVLRPLENLANRVGANLNGIPGYVDAKHVFLGQKTIDWIPLDEGSWFYMPSLYPAASFNQAMEVLQTQDAMIKQIPEVQNVLGKIGRVDSALDPAPAAMIETHVMLKPRSEWRPGMTERRIWDEINAVAKMPGIPTASPLQPIQGRVVMLQSGIKGSMAIRIFGDDLDGLSKAAVAVADELKKHPMVNAGTVAPDIVMGKPYFEFEIDREQSARYGMTTMMVNEIVAAGLGGVDVTETVEGRERYPIQVRFERGVRERVDDLERIPVVTHAGEATVPLGSLAKLKTTWGPGAINSEGARLVANVPFAPKKQFGAIETVDSVMAALRTARAENKLRFPDGNFELQPVGSFEDQVRTNARLLWLGPLLDIDEPKTVTSTADRIAWILNRVPLGLVPLVLVINLLLLYLDFRSLPISMVVFSGIPVAFAGGMIAVALMGVGMNTAVWVGFIALFGIAVDDGVVMATYINQRLGDREPGSVSELRTIVYEAGLKRVRPCLMTTVTTIVALIPVLISDGRGADIARSMAIPVFGGMLVEPFTSFIVPTLYCAYREFRLKLHPSESLQTTGSTQQEALSTA